MSGPAAPDGTRTDGDSILCPWCLKANRDLWDFEWGSRDCIETECSTCDKPFTLSRVIHVSYTAKPVVQ